MERLLTKCCWAEPESGYYHPEDDDRPVYCPKCFTEDPHVEWVEMCDYCKRPGRYCECP